jgi:hypothetical protein
MLKYSMHLPHPLDSSLRSLLWLGGRVPGMCPRSHTDVPRTLHVQRDSRDAHPEQHRPRTRTHHTYSYVLSLPPPLRSCCCWVQSAESRKRKRKALTRCTRFICFIFFKFWCTLEK